MSHDDRSRLSPALSGSDFAVDSQAGSLDREMTARLALVIGGGAGVLGVVLVLLLLSSNAFSGPYSRSIQPAAITALVVLLLAYVGPGALLACSSTFTRQRSIAGPIIALITALWLLLVCAVSAVMQALIYWHARNWDALVQCIADGVLGTTCVKLVYHIVRLVVFPRADRPRKESILDSTVTLPVNDIAVVFNTRWLRRHCRAVARVLGAGQIVEGAALAIIGLICFVLSITSTWRPPPDKTQASSPPLPPFSGDLHDQNGLAAANRSLIIQAADEDYPLSESQRQRLDDVLREIGNTCIPKGAKSNFSNEDVRRWLRSIASEDEFRRELRSKGALYIWSTQIALADPQVTKVGPYYRFGRSGIVLNGGLFYSDRPQQWHWSAASANRAVNEANYKASGMFTQQQAESLGGIIRSAPAALATDPHPDVSFPSLRTELRSDRVLEVTFADNRPSWIDPDGTISQVPPEVVAAQQAAEERRKWDSSRRLLIPPSVPGALAFLVFLDAALGIRVFIAGNRTSGALASLLKTQLACSILILIACVLLWLLLFRSPSWSSRSGFATGTTAVLIFIAIWAVVGGFIMPVRLNHAIKPAVTSIAT